MDGDFDDVAFGSSGIRGPYPERISPELALRIGRAVGSMADERVVVGRDSRTSSPTLERALVAGVTGAGTDVTQLGLAPTPTVAYATRDHALGVVVTASHNPPADNGFKIFRPDGSALDEAGRRQLVERIQDPPASVAWDATGTATEDRSRIQGYEATLIDRSGPLPGTPRIVVDPGHGAAVSIAPRLFRRARASVMTVNATPDGTFPGRPSEPTPSNLEETARIVGATDAIAGLVHDGDADRVVAIDEDGRVLAGDHVVVLLARELNAESIAVPVDTSQLVWDALPGVDIEVTPVGDAYVSERVAEVQADFGGEASGAMILPGVSLCPDGPHAGLLLAHIAARNGGLASLVDAMPSYATLRESHDCPERAKPRAMARIEEELAAMGEIHRVDGVRLTTDDGWALVRPSGTEPKLRLTAEAADEDEARRLLSLVRDVAERARQEVQVDA